MKFSLNWLREFVDTKGLDPKKIGESLTFHTCELEEIIPVSQNFERVFAGKLLSVEKHKNSDSLHVGMFDCGKQGKKQIVFGNVFSLTLGEIYPIALDGAKLASGMVISNTKVREVPSEGMICTCPELGMKQETLLRFEKEDIGKSLPEIVLEFGDILFDIDNKSLTHRPDLMGHRGLAREISAIWKKDFEPKIFAPEIDGKTPFPVKIETEKCRRFCAIKLENIVVEPSDLVTQARLENLGIRSISNIVDLTNLSLAGFGQPMHAFDADALKGGITVRMAKKGEKLLALDEKEYELTEQDIVVADDEKVLSIAGIMGGLGSSVTEKTTAIVFESANFDAANIRHTSARLGLRSESSMRYEKSLDPEQCLETILWATGKAQQVCPKATIASAVGDAFPHPFPPKKIDFPLDLVRIKSGIDISNKDIIEKLEALGFETNMTGATARVIVPSWRATKDIEIPEDLVEEVVRLYGFNEVPSTLPTLPITPPRRNKVRETEWLLRDALLSKGRNEVYLTSFVGPQDAEWRESREHVTIQNGANEEYEKLRCTLLSNAVRGMESELRTQGVLNLFEIGTIFPAIGKEKRMLLLFSAIMNGNGVEMFFQQKTELLHVLQSLGVQGEIKACTTPSSLMHPAQCAEILVEKQVIGHIAVLHPKKNPVRNSMVVFTELDIRALSLLIANAQLRYVEHSSFPAVRRDLSLVVKKNIQQADLVSEMRKATEIIASVDLFDVFLDTEKLGKENKNVTFHLVFQAIDKTLNEKEIDSAMNKIESVLFKKFNAELRLAFDQKKS